MLSWILETHTEENLAEQLTAFRGYIHFNDRWKSLLVC